MYFLPCTFLFIVSILYGTLHFLSPQIYSFIWQIHNEQFTVLGAENLVVSKTYSLAHKAHELHMIKDEYIIYK